MEAISQISHQSLAASATLDSSSPLFSNRQSAQSGISTLQKAPEATMSEAAVKGAIQQANQTLKNQALETSVSFGYESKLGQMFVQIHDGAGSVIGEFPSKSQRALQIAMNEMVGLLLDKKG